MRRKAQLIRLADVLLAIKFQVYMVQPVGTVSARRSRKRKDMGRGKVFVAVLVSLAVIGASPAGAVHWLIHYGRRASL